MQRGWKPRLLCILKFLYIMESGQGAQLFHVAAANQNRACTGAATKIDFP